MKSAVFSLFSVASAVLVTQTEYHTFYVTVDPFHHKVIPTSAPVISSEATSVAAATAESSPVVTVSVEESPVITVSVAPETSSAPVVPVVTTTVLPAAETPTTSSTPSSTSTTSTPPPPPTTTAAPTTSSTTTSSAPATTSAGLTPFEQDIVNYHNRVRAEHHVGPVTWSDELASYASNYLAGDNCVFKHSGGPYGENIAIGYSTIDAAQDAWYNEEDLYDYAAGQFSKSTGHFTQMVWKGTSEVGCATQDCSGRTFLVCEYKAPGNVIGWFTQNVFPK